MTKAPLDPSNKPPPAEPDQYMYARQDSDAAQHPRLIEEHHVVGPQGEDDIEATDETGRRWYHLRPDPCGRLDMFGFNYTWWLIWICVLFIIFLPWGHGWGY